MFSKLDKNNDGYLTKKELIEGFKGIKSEKEIDELLRVVDTDKNGAINYTEFIAAMLNADLLAEHRMRQGFD